MPLAVEVTQVPEFAGNLFITGRRRKIAKTIPIREKATQSSSFEELYKPHEKKIFQLLLRITRIREDAEDALQEACLQAYIHRDQFDGRSSFATWLTRIAINSALMILRKRRNSRIVDLRGSNDSEEEAFPEVVDPSLNPEQLLLQSEREEALHNEVGSLRPAIRKAIQLQLLNERPMKEAAKLMRISVSAAKGRLFHAKAALRKSRKLKLFSQKLQYKPIKPLMTARKPGVASSFQARNNDSQFQKRIAQRFSWKGKVDEFHVERLEDFPDGGACCNVFFPE